MIRTKAPRNKTLTIEDDEKSLLSAKVITLSTHTSFIEIENKIIHQDLLDCLPLLPNAFVDLLIIDPPYNLTKQFSSTRFAKTTPQQYEDWLDSWLKDIVKCLKKTASIYVCCDWQSSHSIQTVLSKYFTVRNRITWEREKGRGATSNWKNNSEDIWFCTVSNDYFFDVEAVKLKKKVIAPYRDAAGRPKDWQETEQGNYRLTFPSNLWTDISIPFWSMSENTDHPTQKPEKLVAKLILASSSEGDVVFDPFIGSGTTCVVAKKLGRKFLGIEREEDYCHMAVKRLMKADNDTSIQGYQQGFFWERNSLADQKVSQTGPKSSPISSLGLFDD